MNSVRLRFGGADDKAILVRSTIDRSWHLAPKTDEQLQFGRDDLVSVKNVSEHRVLIRLQATSNRHPIIARSSRRAAFTVSQTTDDALWFQPGEVLNLRATNARNPNSAGQSVSV